MLAALAPLKWLGEKLLSLREDAAKEKARRWERVASWVDELAQALDQAVVAFKAGDIPWADYSFLRNLVQHVDGVLYRIYDNSKPAEETAVKTIKKQLEGSVQRIEDLDMDPRMMLRHADLQFRAMTAGSFRALAKTLRARA
jgi:hypothetical protein